MDSRPFSQLNPESQDRFGRSFVLDAEIKLIQSQIDTCQTTIARAARLDRDVTTFDDVLVKWTFLEQQASILADGLPSGDTGIGVPATNPLSIDQALALALDVTERRNAVSRATSALERANRQLTATVGRQANANSAILATGAKLVRLNQDLATLKSAPLRDQSLAAGALILRYWPFGLIILLGMKLARPPKPTPHPSTPASPPTGTEPSGNPVTAPQTRP